MIRQLRISVKSGMRLLRVAAVASSSAAAVFSGMYPLFAYYSFPVHTLISLTLLLLGGCLVVHGVLTHALNDYTDYRSGTDALSPALLSGGSRVIQEGLIQPHTLFRIGCWLLAALGVSAAILGGAGYYRLAALILIGIWGAASYSLPPFRFSYIPLAGEWLSTFPSAFFIGLAGPWFLIRPIPEWAVQNAVINALYCIAWVMVHHIPDRHADRQATPAKVTSVVWAAEALGAAYSRLPSLAYFLLTGLCALWLAPDRPWAAAEVAAVSAVSLFLVGAADEGDAEAVTRTEKILLLLAVVNAVWLGLFI